MNATASDGGGEPPAPPADAAETAYFRAIEEAFVRLRGAPLLLSPTDFQVASRWYREGVPLGLVVASLEEVFAKRRERGAKGRINSLRYGAPAVDAAWAEVQELQGPARRAAPAEVAVEKRLDELAAALPAELADREAWGRRLAVLGGDAEGVEAALRGLDDELVASTAAALAPPARERLDAEVEAIVEGLRDRFPDAELAALREQLFRQRLRRLLGLPVLTLF
ncbi:MAG TPA: hypothetical protein VGV61_14620 [Thermoanaerobaculia bacterium]|jgi:hypothetical protein|nr:hypothetical protein [Thermoanaerobaculia bacterium]